MNRLGWRPAAAIARRDLHRSLSGLRLLFLCVFLGVATLAAIGGLTAAITGELADRGRILLGGDVQVEMSQRQASADELATMRREGEVSETVRMRAMARTGGGAAVLAELKAVDQAYPLYGSLVVEGRTARTPGPDEIYIAPELADRLGVGRGGRLAFGEAEYRIAGLIDEEPDRVGEGFTLGPVAIVSMAGLERTRLVQPGSLISSKYRIRIGGGTEPSAVVDRLKDAFPQSGWEFRDRDRAAPGASRFFERMGQFLGLIGLAALIIAGIGVSNGVAAYLRRKRDGIATLKMLGATSADINRIYFLQVGLVAILAILSGLIVGTLIQGVGIAFAADLLPVRPGIGIYPLPLATSAAYGLLMAFASVVPPLGIARRLPVAALFRDQVASHRSPGIAALLTAAAALALILVIAVSAAREPLFSLSVLGAVGGAVLLLAAFGIGVRRLARAVPRPRQPLLRLAIAGLHRPGSQSVGIVVALGLALTLLTSIAAIQTSIAAEIATSVPDRAPDQFILDIPSDQRGRFERLVGKRAPRADLSIVPNLRGMITGYGDTRVADLDKLPEGAWFLRGERGVTYSPTLPEGSDLVAGRWWPADYGGPPLVSLDADAARVLGLGVGDRMTVSILGREIDARIASLREIHWDSLGFNYILVFAPTALEAAPHNLAATVDHGGEFPSGFARAIVAAFPSATIIDVKEIIAEVTTILGQMSFAILAAAFAAVLAGIAVLIGALSASRLARSYDSVILKTLGATRRQILLVQAIEYALLALVVVVIALALGLGGAWVVIVQIFDFGWRPDWPTVLGTLGVGATLTLGIALVSALPLLRLRPAAGLREL